MATRKPRRPANTPRWYFPASLEREYTRDLLLLSRQIAKGVRELVLPSLPRFVGEVEYDNPDAVEARDRLKTIIKMREELLSIGRRDDFLDDINNLLLFLRETLAPPIQVAISRAAVMGLRISKQNKKQFEKTVKAVTTFDLFYKEPWLTDQLKLFADQNSKLITSMADEEIERVAGIIERGLQQGLRSSSIAEEIKKTFGISDRKAKLIARDQTAKLNSSLTSLRQQELGVTEYEWQTSGDERVRPTHRANEGKIFRWDRPSPITGHPGHDVNCRCVALPILDKLLNL